jgi:hypothetical protein
VLDEHMQTSVPGLFVTGFAATCDFGPFFGFVRACPAAAQIIVRGTRQKWIVGTGRGPAHQRRLAVTSGQDTLHCR